MRVWITNLFHIVLVFLARFGNPSNRALSFTETFLWINENQYRRPHH